MDPLLGPVLASLANVLIKVLGALALYLAGRNAQAAKDHAAGLELVAKAWKDLADSRGRPESAPDLGVSEHAGTIVETPATGDPGRVQRPGETAAVPMPGKVQGRKD